MYEESKRIKDEAWDCTLIRQMKERGDSIVNPIYHWTSDDVWKYIRQEGIETNPLYQCGYDRVGCIGCPLASYRGRIKEFSDYPKYKNLYIKAFERMLIVRKQKELPAIWQTGQEVFDWWIEEYKHNVKGQMTIEDWLSEKRNEE